MRKCEFCGYEETTSPTYAVKRYNHYDMKLCDRCVDKINSYHNGKDIDEYWEDDDAIRCGFEEFPRNKTFPEYRITCEKELCRICGELNSIISIDEKYNGFDDQSKKFAKYEVKSSVNHIKDMLNKILEKYEER